MKKIILLLTLIILGTTVSAEDFDYQQIYRDLPVPDVKYIHNIDPGEYYDTETSTWSPYPLFRLVAPLYFKSITIEPGYYLLTPREHKGDWYILFKEAGRIKYIVPVYNRDLTPVMFYDENLPKPELKFSQRMHLKQTYLELTDLDNNFISLVIYWGNYRYYTIFRTTQL